MADKNENDQEPRTFTQEEVDLIIGKRLARERDNVAAAQKDAAIKAEVDKLAAEKKWQDLAAHHEARATELEPYKAQAEAYSALVASMLKERIKTLGEAAKKFVASLPESMVVAEKLELLNKNEALFGKGSVVGTPASKRLKKQTNDKPSAREGHRRLRM